MGVEGTWSLPLSSSSDAPPSVWGATVMGDVRVGEGATVLPHSVLLPGSRVGPGETWGGVPAQRIEQKEMGRLKESIRGGQPVDLGS